MYKGLNKSKGGGGINQAYYLQLTKNTYNKKFSHLYYLFVRRFRAILN